MARHVFYHAKVTGTSISGYSNGRETDVQNVVSLWPSHISDARQTLLPPYVKIPVGERVIRGSRALHDLSRVLHLEVADSITFRQSDR